MLMSDFGIAATSEVFNPEFTEGVTLPVFCCCKKWISFIKSFSFLLVLFNESKVHKRLPNKASKGKLPNSSNRLYRFSASRWSYCFSKTAHFSSESGKSFCSLSLSPKMLSKSLSSIFYDFIAL